MEGQEEVKGESSVSKVTDQISLLTPGSNLNEGN